MQSYNKYSTPRPVAPETCAGACKTWHRAGSSLYTDVAVMHALGRTCGSKGCMGQRRQQQVGRGCQRGSTLAQQQRAVRLRHRHQARAARRVHYQRWACQAVHIRHAPWSMRARLVTMPRQGWLLRSHSGSDKTSWCRSSGGLPLCEACEHEALTVLCNTLGACQRMDTHLQHLQQDLHNPAAAACIVHLQQR